MTTNQYGGNAILNLVLTAANWPNIADNTATAPLVNLWIALHTADPGASGNQSTSEIGYTGYSRVSVARTVGGWTTSSANSSSPQANIVFPSGTGGSGTATFASIGIASGGATQIIWSGPVAPSIVCGNGVTPTLTTASSVVLT